MSMTLKEILNYVLGQSSFLERDAFASSQDPDNIQMVAFANRAAATINDHYPWQKLRKSTTITMVAGQLAYDLPADFDYYLTESMWKSNGARDVVIPTSDRYWGFLKAGNPGTGIQYYAKLIAGKLEFVAVTDGDEINLDYQSAYPITDGSGTPKSRFTADTDLFLLNDETLALGVKALWKTEKEIPTAAYDMQEFRANMKRDIAADTGAKVIRQDANRTPFTPPISSAYQW